MIGKNVAVLAAAVGLGCLPLHAAWDAIESMPDGNLPVGWQNYTTLDLQQTPTAFFDTGTKTWYRLAADMKADYPELETLEWSLPAVRSALPGAVVYEVVRLACDLPRDAYTARRVDPTGDVSFRLEPDTATLTAVAWVELEPHTDPEIAQRLEALDERDADLAGALAAMRAETDARLADLGAHTVRLAEADERLRETGVQQAWLFGAATMLGFLIGASGLLVKLWRLLPTRRTGRTRPPRHDPAPSGG